jgi:Glycosyl transferase family 2
MSEKLLIVIPAYNEEKNIAKCINELQATLREKYEIPYEIIVVNRDCGPYRACHFNLTLEMSLGALIRDYHIAQIPIRWYGRTWGSSNLRLGEMGRRYLSTLLMMFFQRYLIADDLLANRLASNVSYHYQLQDLAVRISAVEEKLEFYLTYQRDSPDRIGPGDCGGGPPGLRSR